MNSLEGLIRRDEFQALMLTLVRERNAARANWDEQAWRHRVVLDWDQFIKHLLYAGRVAEAREKWRWAVQAVGRHAKLRRLRSKLRKAWWLGLIGKRLKHPKGDAFRM